MTIAIDYSKKNDFDHARNECARLLPMIHAAIDEGRRIDQMLLESVHDYWGRRMDILSGMAELADPDYEASVKIYAQDVAKWLMMKENGLLDADMKFPTFPSRNIPF